MEYTAVEPTIPPPTREPFAVPRCNCTRATHLSNKVEDTEKTSVNNGGTSAESKIEKTELIDRSSKAMSGITTPISAPVVGTQRYVSIASDYAVSIFIFLAIFFTFGTWSAFYFGPSVLNVGTSGADAPIGIHTARHFLWWEIVPVPYNVGWFLSSIICLLYVLIIVFFLALVFSDPGCFSIEEATTLLRERTLLDNKVQALEQRIAAFTSTLASKQDPTTPDMVVSGMDMELLALREQQRAVELVATMTWCVNCRWYMHHHDHHCAMLGVCVAGRNFGLFIALLWCFTLVCWVHFIYSVTFLRTAVSWPATPALSLTPVWHYLVTCFMKFEIAAPVFFVLLSIYVGVYVSVMSLYFTLALSRHRQSQLLRTRNRHVVEGKGLATWDKNIYPTSVALYDDMVSRQLYDYHRVSPYFRDDDHGRLWRRKWYLWRRLMGVQWFIRACLRGLAVAWSDERGYPLR